MMQDDVQILSLPQVTETVGVQTCLAKWARAVEQLHELGCSKCHQPFRRSNDVEHVCVMMK